MNCPEATSNYDGEQLRQSRTNKFIDAIEIQDFQS